MLPNLPKAPSGNPQKKEFIFVALIFCLALCLRLGYTFFLKSHYSFGDLPGDDVRYYQEWGASIADGNWLGNHAFYGLPLYPYFWAVLLRLTLGNIFLIRLILLALGSLNCVLIYFLALKIFSKRTAVIASLLAATNFMLIYYDWLMMPVTLLIALSLVIILSFLYLDDTSPLRQWFILGILIGLGTLGDGKFILFLGISLIYLLARYRKECPKRLLKILACVVGGAFIIIFSVTLRNRIVSNDWVFISAQTGLSFYVGNNPEATGIFENPDFIRPDHSGQDEDQVVLAQLASRQSLKPSQVSKFWYQKGLSFIKTSPAQYAKLLRKKIVAFLTDNEYGHDIDLIMQKEWKDVLDVNSFRVICPAALVGIILSIRSPGVLWPNLLMAGQFIFTLIFFTTTRHRMTILPFFLVYESFFIVWVIDQARQKEFKKLLLPLPAFFLLLFLFEPARLHPDLIRFYHLTRSGYAHIIDKNYAKAQEDYRQALTIHPSDTNALYNLGNIYAAKNNFSEAARYYQKVLSVNSFDINAIFNLAYCFEQLGDINSAIKGYEKVLALAPKNSADAHYRLAGIYHSQGNCQTSKEHYDAVLKINPLVPLSIPPCRPK
ncbi:MAG TPA: tetratricopeptide repeat protein [Candidatus Omnitrophota bacterium]|nr:tetratricopeptide repeat protein [Candidatus Omnitrophota bacterium]HPD85307.1 tetratricopeptide repeat protein [Candidatus Omnitrophota bacterium]HRZ04192.1 tetratricopeptide repeat protein [Candidatus Omnitrophota bacterium]